MSELLFCEMCGAPIRGKAYKVRLEGATITVCERCYHKILSSPGTVEPLSTIKKKPKTQYRPKPTPKPKRSRYVEYEVVDDYAEKIRKARERMGWTTNILAQRVMEKETVLKRIEQGRLRPSIDLAMRLEKALGISLLEPIVDETEETDVMMGGHTELTLGDLANIKIKGKRK